MKYVSLQEFHYLSRSGKIKTIERGEVFFEYSRGYRSNHNCVPARVIKENPAFFNPLDASAGDLVIRENQPYIFLGITKERGVASFATITRNKTLYVNINEKFQDFKKAAPPEIIAFFREGDVISFVTLDYKFCEKVTILRISDDATSFAYSTNDGIVTLKWNEVKFLKKEQTQEAISINSYNFLLKRVEEIRNFYLAHTQCEDAPFMLTINAFNSALNSVRSTIESMKVIP